MKKITKLLVGTATCAFAFAAVSLSCTRVQVQGSAATAFADTQKPAVTIPSESLKVIEALQNSFRSISSGVLPSVVEIDVTERGNARAQPVFQNAALQGIFADEEVDGFQIVRLLAHVSILPLRAHHDALSRELE